MTQPNAFDDVDELGRPRQYVPLRQNQATDPTGNVPQPNQLQRHLENQGAPTLDYMWPPHSRYGMVPAVPLPTQTEMTRRYSPADARLPRNNPMGDEYSKIDQQLMQHWLANPTPENAQQIRDYMMSSGAGYPVTPKPPWQRVPRIVPQT